MIKSTVYKIDPAAAKNILLMNTNNYRALDFRRVKLYAKEMSSNNWELTGDTIKISSEDVLLDGQHRLHAIIKSNSTVNMIVVEGIETNSDHIDRGKPRTIGQALKNHNIKNANNVSATAKKILIAQKGLWAKQVIQTGDITDSEIIKFSIENQDAIHDCLKITGSCRLLTNSLFASMVYIVSGGDPYNDDDVKWFVKSLTSGEGLDNNEPVYLLRELLIKDKANPQIRKSPYIIRMLLTLAWNKTVKGESLKILKFAVTGPAKTKPVDLLVPGEF